MMFKIQVALLLPLFTAVYAQSSFFSILSPKDLYEKNVEHTEAQFGIPNFQGLMTGIVYYVKEWPKGTSKPDGKEDLGFDWCDPYPGKTPWEQDEKQTVNIVLIPRGTCTFVQKVKNAQDRKADLVVIFDNINEAVLPTMADDLTGQNIVISALLIQKAKGLSLIEKINAKKLVKAELEWSITDKESNLVKWKLWTSSGPNTPATEFVEHFKQPYLALGDKAELEPHFLIINGDIYSCRNPDIDCSTQCTNGGRYCAEDPEGLIGSGIEGYHILQENLRQICMWRELKKSPVKKNLAKWWDYVDSFDENCENLENFNKDCSTQQMVAVNFTESEMAGTKLCVDQSGGLGGDDFSKDVKNTVFEDELEARKKDLVNILPTIMVQGKVYRGRTTCFPPISRATCGVLGAICNSFLRPDQVPACREDYCWETTDDCGECRSGTDDKDFNSTCCDQTPGKRQDVCGICGGTATSRDECKTKPNITWIIVVCVFFSVVLALVGLWFIKRKERRMKNYVENIVANYMPLQDGGGPTVNLGDYKGPTNPIMSSNQAEDSLVV